MYSTPCPAPLLPLYLPTSPLLSGVLTQDLFAALTSQGIGSPLPTLSFSQPSPSNQLSLNRPCASKSSSPITQTHKPLPVLFEGFCSTQISALYDLLEEMGQDMGREIKRVGLGIAETRAMIAEHRRSQEALKSKLVLLGDGLE